MECLLRPVMSNTSFRPAVTASSTTYWMAGLSMTGSISLGVALVAGKNLVPRPAAGITALVTSAMVRTLANPRDDPGHGTLLAPLAVRWPRARASAGQGSPPHPAAQSPVRAGPR